MTAKHVSSRHGQIAEQLHVFLFAALLDRLDEVLNTGKKYFIIGTSNKKYEVCFSALPTMIWPFPDV